MRIAVALLDADISVEEALGTSMVSDPIIQFLAKGSHLETYTNELNQLPAVFQSETKMGNHTASSGNFLREFPGRLVLYPAVASTCAVIFFGGDWTDFGIAALAGLVAGLVEYGLSLVGGGVLTDYMVGTSVGIVAGLFYRFGGEDICVSSVFLGTRK